MKLPKKLQEKVEAAIAELEHLANNETNSADAKGYRKIAINLKRGEWAAAYRNTWHMDTYPRDGISSFTFRIIELLGA